MSMEKYGKDVWAVTGHRPDKLPDKTSGYRNTEQAKVAAFATEVLRYFHPTTVLTGMALGWDTAVAEGCRALSIPYIACIPFEGQEGKWFESSVRKYKDLLSTAKEVVIVSPGGYSPEKMHARNAYMVDHSITLLALWNSTPGGTAGCVQNATKKKHPVINVWDAYVHYRETGEFSG